jgi:hypothetical protein
VLTPSNKLAIYATASDGHVWGSGPASVGGSFGGWSIMGSSSSGVASRPQPLIAFNGTVAIYARWSDGKIHGVGQATVGGSFGSWTNAH